MGRKGSQRKPRSHRATVCGCIIVTIIIIIIVAVVVNLGSPYLLRSYFLTWILQTDRDQRVQGFSHTEPLFSQHLKTSRPRNSSRGPELNSGARGPRNCTATQETAWARWKSVRRAGSPADGQYLCVCSRAGSVLLHPATLFLQGPMEANALCATWKPPATR